MPPKRGNGMAPLQKVEKEGRIIQEGMKKWSQTCYKDMLTMAIERSKNEGRDYSPNSRR